MKLFQVLYELILGIFTLTGEFLCQKKKNRDRRKLTMMYAFCKDISQILLQALSPRLPRPSQSATPVVFVQAQESREANRMQPFDGNERTANADAHCHFAHEN